MAGSDCDWFPSCNARTLRNHLSLSQDGECFSAKKPGTDQSPGLGVTNAKTTATRFWSRPSLLDCPSRKSKWDTDPCLHRHVSYPTTTQQKCVEKSKQEPAGIPESSRNFHEKIRGKDRDPLHAIAALKPTKPSTDTRIPPCLPEIFNRTPVVVCKHKIVRLLASNTAH